MDVSDTFLRLLLVHLNIFLCIFTPSSPEYFLAFIYTTENIIKTLAGMASVEMSGGGELWKQEGEMTTPSEGTTNATTLDSCKPFADLKSREHQRWPTLVIHTPLQGIPYLLRGILHAEHQSTGHTHKPSHLCRWRYGVVHACCARDMSSSPPCYANSCKRHCVPRTNPFLG